MRRIAIVLILLAPGIASANPPVASYIFPAGGQRGTKVNVKVGGLFLHQKCGFEMLGQGISAPGFLTRTKTAWFEGPLLPLPDSQRQEDYPKDMAGQLAIAADATLGIRAWRVWTSQGATPSMKFVVGDLPEVVEAEIDGDPAPVSVALPVTINGRIFPREDIDIYAFSARKDQSVRCEVQSARLGYPLDARLEVRDAQGRRIAESDASGSDPALTFAAPADGEYRVHIHDVRMLGGQAFVYRLTIIADAHVTNVFPLGGQRGSTVEFNLDEREKQNVAIPKDAPRDWPFTFSARGKPSNALWLDVDSHPEFTDASRPIPLPAILNGRIAKPGQIDDWKWHGKKGETWEFELRAARLGSKLDGIVTICDREGKTLTKAEATASDCTARFTVPADGEHRVQVQDRFRSRGGPDFAYRLRVTPPPAPDFRLTLATDAITVPRKGSAKLKINIERVGAHKELIDIDGQNLPAGVSIAKAIVQPNQPAVELMFKADESARIDVARLRIVGKSKASERVAALPIGRGVADQTSVLLSVALPTPFVIKGDYDMGFAARGGMHKRKYKIERNGFDGPIEVSLTDKQARHLQGVEGPTIIVPAGVSEFTYSAYLPPWMETGRTCRVCVMGVGVVKEPDGSEHRVSFSSVNQNEQLVAVVGPGKLAMEAERTSFRAAPGKSFTVSVKVQRGQGIDGPVTLELVTPSHVRGLSAAKTTLGAKQDRGELIVTCADKLVGPFNMPMIVRATLMRDGEPIVAEVKLDVQP